MFPSGPPGIAFDLVIPSNTPVGDYNGVSGTSIKTELTPINNDTVPEYIESSVVAYYGQFVSASTSPKPSRVVLNRDTLIRHAGTDTLRLDQGSALRDLVGDNYWKIFGENGDTVTFISPALGPLDSISPLYQKDVRGDTSLTLRWKGGAGAGVMLTWTHEGSGYVFSRAYGDNGSLTIPVDEMKKLRGVGTVTLVRYRSTNHLYNGKTVVLTRLSQRHYDVTVL